MSADANLAAYLAGRKSASSKLFAAPYPDRAQMEDILQLALRTPDHGKLEPWRLVGLDRAALLGLADLGEARARELGTDAERIEKGRSQFDRSHAAVAVLSSPKEAAKVPVAEQILSAGALCMNILHAAHALGWSANWLTGWVSHDDVFPVRAFACRPGETVAGIIHFGTAPAGVPERPRPELARVFEWARR